MNARGKKIPCLSCGGRRTEFFRRVRNMDPKTETVFPWIALSVCRACGLIGQNPCLSQAQMDDFYSKYEDKVTAAASDRVTDAENRSRVDGLLAALPRPAKILEVGSSDGTFLDLARRAGYKVAGMDPSRANCLKARRRHPAIRVERCFLKDYPAGETFDAVCHFFVLEHSFEPIEFLAQCRRLLKPGGLVYFEIPNVAVFGRLPFANNLFIYQHVSHFSPATVGDLLARAGYRLLAVDGKLGRSPKSYGMRVAAVAEGAPKAPRANRYSAERKLLAGYFKRRDALVAGIEKRARRWTADVAKRPGPVVIFGAGENGRILNATSLKTCGRPMYFCDNNARLQGRMIDGRRVLKPARVPALKPALVVATSIDYQTDMARQMVAAGVPAERVVKLYQGY